MAVIAIVPLELTASADVWNCWKQWDYYRRFAPVAAHRSSVEYEIYLQRGDSLSVEVHDVLLKQPINGIRTVHSDGKIDLGCYGRVYVAGLTISETKEKIIFRLITVLLAGASIATFGEAYDDLGSLLHIDPR